MAGREDFADLCLEGATEEIQELCRSQPELVRKSFAHFGGFSAWRWGFGGKATGLHLAASKGREDCCRVLLDHGTASKHKMAAVVRL